MKWLIEKSCQSAIGYPSFFTPSHPTIDVHLSTYNGNLAVAVYLFQFNTCHHHPPPSATDCPYCTWNIASNFPISFDMKFNDIPAYKNIDKVLHSTMWVGGTFEIQVELKSKFSNYG